MPRPCTLLLAGPGHRRRPVRLLRRRGRGPRRRASPPATRPATAGSTELTAGTTTFAISNDGEKVTEVYVYAPAAVSRIVTEKENIGPGTVLRAHRRRSKPGTYEVACKPGQTGDGIRSAITVTGRARPAADPQAAKAVAAYRAYVQAAGRRAAARWSTSSWPRSRPATSRRRRRCTRRPASPWEARRARRRELRRPRPAGRPARGRPRGRPGVDRLAPDREGAVDRRQPRPGMAPVADQLATDVRELQAKVPTAEMTVASIGNGAKELLDEVATGKITGEEEAFSHTDLVDFQANLDGAQKAYEVLRPLVVDDRAARDARRRVRRVQDGARQAPRRRPASCPTTRSTSRQRRELARVVDGARRAAVPADGGGRGDRAAPAA